MHCDRGLKSAKFWLDLDVLLEVNRGFRRNELRNIERVLRTNLEILRHEWDSFCGAGTG
jgi:Domain of unknown function (DUF4160)